MNLVANMGKESQQMHKLWPATNAAQRHSSFQTAKKIRISSLSVINRGRQPKSTEECKKTARHGSSKTKQDPGQRRKFSQQDSGKLRQLQGNDAGKTKASTKQVRCTGIQKNCKTWLQGNQDNCQRRIQGTKVSCKARIHKNQGSCRVRVQGKPRQQPNRDPCRETEETAR